MKMQHYGWKLAGGLIVLPQILCGQSDGTPQKRPHIILLMTDQQRWDALGCAGNRAVITPNLDRLAAEGNLFTNAYSSVPSSTPARAGLLTGLSPWHHGMLGYGAVAEKYPTEMPRMLADAGYMTFGIGKMHWSPQRSLHGFTATLLDESGRVEDPYFMSDYRKWFITQAFGMDPDATGIGWNGHAAKAYQLPERLHPTKWTADQAVSTIEGYDSEKPLFLKVSFARPHSPYDPPQRFVGMYLERDIPAPTVGEWVSETWRQKADPVAKPNAFIGNFGTEYARNSRRYYYAAITFIDEQIGRIISQLKEKGMYDDALILFVSDHGDMLGDHHLWRKTYAYEGSAAIPLIVKPPKGQTGVVKPGEKVDYPVELRDVLPTFLDAAGARIPESIDGLSLLEIYRNRRPEWRKYIDLEHAAIYWDGNYWCALTDGKVKYVFFFPTGEEQLFDLEKDPYECTDLSNNPGSSKLLDRMRSAMVSHLSERGPDWVDGDRPAVRKSRLLYSPNYPAKRGK